MPREGEPPSLLPSQELCTPATGPWGLLWVEGGGACPIIEWPQRPSILLSCSAVVVTSQTRLTPTSCGVQILQARRIWVHYV